MILQSNLESQYKVNKNGPILIEFHFLIHIC